MMLTWKTCWPLWDRPSPLSAPKPTISCRWPMLNCRCCLLRRTRIAAGNRLDRHFTHSRFARAASRSHSAAALTEYDGLVPAAGTDLDPTAADRVSPSRLETYGVCPRRFFFSRGLGVYPPDEWVVDWERWLDPLQYGNFVHALFERFLRGLTERDLTPKLDRDLQPLRELLHTGIDELKSEIPIPNQDAFHRTRDLLEETCEIFLVKEEEYCRKYDAQTLGAGSCDRTGRTTADRAGLPRADSTGTF